MPAWWLIALRAIPWTTILRNAPAIVDATGRLAAGARTRTGTIAGDLESLRDRVGELEAHDQAHADVVKQLADQVHELTGALQSLAARLRLALYLGAVAVMFAAVALGMTFAHR